MRIAVLGSTLYPAPSEYGKINAPVKITFDLAGGLSELGHEVTFFGLVNEESKKVINFKIDDSYCIRPTDVNNREKFLKIACETAFFSRVMEKESGNFDIIYTHSYLIGSLASLSTKPVIFTHHDATRVLDYSEIFTAISRKNLYPIPVSKYLKFLYPDKVFLEPVHNGVDIDEFSAEPEDYIAWAGRIAKPKGLHVAVDLATSLGFNLKFAGPTGNHGGLGNTDEYWQDIEKKMGGQTNIEYVGVLSQESTYKFISRAKAFIFPTDGTESFSMVVAESMIMGTPVIALKNGPMSELIEEGVTGFLCRDIDEMKLAIGKIGAINRQRCRDVAKEKFSVRNMAKGYEARFLALLENS